ncbi:hypothetical protein KUCAC02_029303, partial [Chaenocephalus aceratus]
LCILSGWGQRSALWRLGSTVVRRLHSVAKDRPCFSPSVLSSHATYQPIATSSTPAVSASSSVSQSTSRTQFTGPYHITLQALTIERTCRSLAQRHQTPCTRTRLPPRVPTGGPTWLLLTHSRLWRETRSGQ